MKKRDQATAERITDHRKIISFRNVLIHGYAHIDPSRAWDVVQGDLPVLRAEVEQLLHE